MAQTTKSNGSLTVYSLRRAAGMPSKRASGFNACIGGALKGRKYAKPPVGRGGRHNEAVRSAFISAVASCRGGGGTRTNNNG